MKAARERVKPRQAWLRVKPRCAWLWACAVPWSAIAQTHAHAQAQTSEPLSLSVQTQLVASDNTKLQASDAQQRGLVLSVQPSLTYQVRGAALTANLSASLTLLGSAPDTVKRAVLPNLRADGTAAVVERWFHVDASAGLNPTAADVFGAQVNSGTPSTSSTSSTQDDTRILRTLRLQPRLQRDFTPFTSLMAAHEWAWTDNAAGVDGLQTVQRSVVQLGHKPRPWGGRVVWQRQTSDVDAPAAGGSAPTERSLSLESLRFVGLLAVDENWVVGATVGREQNRFDQSLSSGTGTTSQDTLAGVSALWAPSPRTVATLDVERRFFGTGVQFGFQHRTPSWSLRLGAMQQPVSTSSTLGGSGPTLDLRTLLDDVHSTRTPDAAQRAPLVDALVSDRALDTRTASATPTVATYAQLQTGVQAALVLHGNRNTVALSVQQQTLRALERRGNDAALPPALAVSDVRQTSAAVQASRLLSRQTTGQVSLRWQDVRGLNARAGEQSEWVSLRVSLQHQVAPRSDVFAGVQATRFDSSAQGQRDFRAVDVFVGLKHRFGR
jgi:uncharacterized protein (PEP-CTERM system associated)